MAVDAPPFESEELFRSAFDSAPIGMSLTTLDGRWLRVNRALSDITGYSEDELLAMSFRDITHQDDLAENLDVLRRLVTGEISSSHEKRYVHKLGHVVWVRLDHTIVRDASGEPVCLVAQIQDVTEPKLAEAALQRRDAMLAAVASSAERLLQASDWRNVVDEVLAELGTAAAASRAYVFENHEDADGNPVTSQRFEWCAPGIAPQAANATLQCFPLATPGYEEWFERVAGGAAVQANVRDFPDGVREHHAEQDILSVLVVPVFVEKSWWGFIGFDECVAEREWAPAEVEALRAAVGALGAAIQHARAEERYRSLVEHLPLTTYVDNLDDGASSIYISPQIESLLGYTAEEWLADPDFFARILHPDDRATALKAEWPADDGPHRLEFRLVARDGRVVHVLDNYVIRRDAGGRRLHSQGYMLDVTELRHAEEALRETNETLQTLIEASPAAIIGFDRDGRVQRWNPAAERIFGWREEEVNGRFNPIVPEESREEFLGLLERILHGGSWTNLEIRRRRKDGTPVELSVASAPFRDAEGEIVGMISVLTDVTERKQLESQLVQAQRLESLGRLAGGIAHDFNNLLTSISGHTELLLAELEDGDARRSDAEEVARAAERAGALVRQLLTFSRNQVLQTHVVGLRAIVTDLETMLRHLIGEDVELVVELDPALGNVDADSGQIEQLIVNLVVNARDAMPGGGMVTIEGTNVLLDEATAARLSAEPGPYVMLRIGDNGLGMDDATRARAFEPFFTTKEQGKGTGLGLSTVYGIVTQSGGALELDSEPGLGTTFQIYLPLAEEAGETAEPGAEPVAAPRGSETVLLVEDDDAVRNLAERVLAEAGYEVLTASGGWEALELVGRYPNPIDLLLTDVVMPGMNGPELADRLGALRPETRVLFASGYTDGAVFRRELPGGTPAFIAKPFTPDALRRKVREALVVPA